MTREKLMVLLRDPDQTGQSINELNRLIEEYSYFHTGHQLYLQGLKKTDETQFVHQLNKSSLNVRDRSLLYNYINRPSAFRKQTAAPEDEPESPLAPFAPGNAFVTSETDIQVIQQSVTSSPGSVEEDNNGRHSTDGTRGWSGTYPDRETHVAAEEKIISDAELMNIIRQQLNRIDNTPPHPGKGSPEEGYTAEQLASELSEIPKKQPEVPATDKPTETAADVPTQPNNAVNADTGISQKPEEIGTSKEPEQKAIAEAPAPPKQESPADLIDSFLKVNPKIVPNETDYQVNLSDSLIDNQDITTETLADIYAGQGHKQKAIEIYEHLILKNPEKHIYFAAQIDRLKQELI